VVGLAAARRRDDLGLEEGAALAEVGALLGAPHELVGDAERAAHADMQPALLERLPHRGSLRDLVALLAPARKEEPLRRLDRCDAAAAVADDDVAARAQAVVHARPPLAERRDHARLLGMCPFHDNFTPSAST